MMLLLPISDDNDESSAYHHHDFVHWGLIFLCIAGFVVECWMLGTRGVAGLQNFVNFWSFDPHVLGDGYLSLTFQHRAIRLANYLMDVHNLGLVRMLSSCFLHGGIAHIAGNLLVLWMLGDNVEYAMGHFRYLVFFLIAAIVSDCGETLFMTAENFKGGIGASGAIMAVAGAYMFYFSKARINFFYVFMFFWWGTFSLPARLVIGVYVLSQIGEAFADYGTNYDNVAVWAHVTGFLMGITLAWLFRKNCDEPLYQPIARKRYRGSLRSTLQNRQDNWGNDVRK